MKIWKTLMPVATLGATAACVVPMASCGNTYMSVSNADFKPTTVAKHSKTEIKTQTELDTLLGDYFKNPKAFAEDYLYIQTQEVAAEKAAAEKLVTDKAITSFTMDFNIKISDYSVEAKEVEVDGTKIKGYVLSATITTTGSSTTEMTKEQATTLKSGFTKQTTKGNSTMSIKNAFVYISPNYWGSGYAGLVFKGVNPTLNWSESSSSDSTTTYEYVDGTTDTIENHSSSSHSRSSKTDKRVESLAQVIPVMKMEDEPYLSYFEDVTYKIA